MKNIYCILAWQMTVLVGGLLFLIQPLLNYSHEYDSIASIFKRNFADVMMAMVLSTPTILTLMAINWKAKKRKDTKKTLTRKLLVAQVILAIVSFGAIALASGDLEMVLGIGSIMLVYLLIGLIIWYIVINRFYVLNDTESK